MDEDLRDEVSFAARSFNGKPQASSRCSFIVDVATSLWNPKPRPLAADESRRKEMQKRKRPQMDANKSMDQNRAYLRPSAASPRVLLMSPGWRLSTSMNVMKVTLHTVTALGDGAFEIAISFGNDVPKRYRASYKRSAEGAFGAVDEELFMKLSDSAFERFGNCLVYQTELMGILAAFHDGQHVPALPAELGTTSFCTMRPGALRILWNKFRICLDRIGVWRLPRWVDPDWE